MHRPISLYLKACGTAVKALDTMSALGVTLTQKWAIMAVEKVAEQNERPGESSQTGELPYHPRQYQQDVSSIASTNRQ